MAATFALFSGSGQTSKPQISSSPSPPQLVTPTIPSASLQKPQKKQRYSPDQTPLPATLPLTVSVVATAPPLLMRTLLFITDSLIYSMRITSSAVLTASISGHQYLDRVRQLLMQSSADASVRWANALMRFETRMSTLFQVVAEDIAEIEFGPIDMHTSTQNESGSSSVTKEVMQQWWQR